MKGKGKKGTGTKVWEGKRRDEKAKNSERKREKDWMKWQGREGKSRDEGKKGRKDEGTRKRRTTLRVDEGKGRMKGMRLTTKGDEGRIKEGNEGRKDLQSDGRWTGVKVMMGQGRQERMEKKKM